MPGSRVRFPPFPPISKAMNPPGPASIMLRTRGRRWLAGAIAAALVVSLAAMLLRPMLERAVRERIESGAARHGMVCRIGSVHIGVWPFLRLTDFDLDLGHGVRLHADTIAATYPGRLRLTVQKTNLVGPAGLKISSPITAWYVTGTRGKDFELALIEPQAGLSIRQQADSVSNGWIVEAKRLDIGRLLEVRREGLPFLDGGIADGSVNLKSSADALRFHVDIGARG